MWFSSERIHSKQEINNFESTTFSSCDCDDPDWSVMFSSGDFDSKEQWVNMYNATLYIKDVPVFYTPYFGFSTNRTRRSGFLPPTIGFSSDEGLIYAQPYYFAPAIDYDFEYIPQVRTNRGYGNTLKYRHVDSEYSRLYMDAGVFYENDSYVKEQNLLNDKHYGWNIRYDRTKLFAQEDHQDGLQFYAVDMNDVDYSTVQHDDDTGDYNDRYLNSYFRYFYNAKDYFGGFESTYYEDVSLNDNDTTLQNLPTIKLHKYTDTLFLDNLTYGATLEFKRQSRNEGMGANRLSTTIPIVYTRNLLDNYLDFSFGTYLDYTHYNYINNTNGFEDPNYAVATNFVELGTNLIKPYENFIHSMQLYARYEKPNTLQENGDLYPILTTQNELSDFAISENKESISLYFNQSFANNDLETVVDHTVSQNFTYDSQSGNYEEGDLEHDLRLYYENMSFHNRFYYDYNLEKIVRSTSLLQYNGDDIYTRLYYNFSKNKTTLQNQEDFVFQIGYDFNKYYGASYKEEYDLTHNTNKKREYTFHINQKCWALNLKYVNSVVATNTVNRDSKRQNIIYIEIQLRELLNFNQQFKNN
jgi:LPS-assembly protein